MHIHTHIHTHIHIYLYYIQIYMHILHFAWQFVDAACGSTLRVGEMYELGGAVHGMEMEN